MLLLHANWPPARGQDELGVPVCAEEVLVEDELAVLGVLHVEERPQGDDVEEQDLVEDEVDVLVRVAVHVEFSHQTVPHAACLLCQPVMAERVRDVEVEWVPVMATVPHAACLLCQPVLAEWVRDVEV